MDSNAEKSKRHSPKSPLRKKRKAFPIPFESLADLVTFIIGQGDDEKTFSIHKEAACNSSPVLEAAFASESVEGRTKAYRLDDTTERAFRLFMQWMYSGQLRILQLEDTDAASNDTRSENYSLMELWVLANKLYIPRLQNLALQTMIEIEKATGLWEYRHMDYLYANTSAGSSLRRFKVKEYVRHAKAEIFEDFKSSPGLLPNEFLLNLAIFWRSMEVDETSEMDVSKLMVEVD